MAKKRLIFSLFYNDGGFMLSRNFRLQRAGSIEWLKTNYNFRKVSCSIDELVILDVSRNEKNLSRFCEHIKSISEECFIPIATGGGITSLEKAKMVINSGADKLVVNSALFEIPDFVRQLVLTYGSQCVIASLDAKKTSSGFDLYMNNGARKVPLAFPEAIRHVSRLGIGELYLNSIDKDGTGQGYMFELLGQLGGAVKVPVILAGGVGNWHHLLEGLQHGMVDAAATGNLFNFIGNGFPKARAHLLESGINLAKWMSTDFIDLKNCVTRSKDAALNDY